MKFRNIYLVLVAIFAVLVSCKKEQKTEAEDINLEVEKVISGPFSESFEVVNAVLKLSNEPFGTKLLVEVKRTSAPLPIDIDDADLCGSSSGKSQEWCMSADILGENNVPIDTNLDIYGHEPFEKALSLKENETIWLEFSLGYDDNMREKFSNSKKVKIVSSAQSKNGSDLGNVEVDSDFSTSGSSDWDKMLDDYEAYVDKYLEFLKKANKGDISAMQEYPALLEKATELQNSMQKAQDDNQLSPEQIRRMGEIQVKMLNAASEMY